VQYSFIKVIVSVYAIIIFDLSINKYTQFKPVNALVIFSFAPIYREALVLRKITEYQQNSKLSYFNVRSFVSPSIKIYN